ncbi:MAG: hypothetical protein EAY81_11165 [Bacteroidetes bacterium]|nr:MAG: hypothetical protein EAY81_11165 [Bacteroidota bacterium]
MKNLLIVFITAVLFMACKDEGNEDEAGSIGTEYYPIKVGSTWIYTVDSIAYDDNGPTQAIDTFRYKYKETITSTDIDGTGNTEYLVSRYFTPTDTGENWQSVNRYVVQLVNNKVQRVEENVRLVKLVFPLKDRNSWNGNMFNGKEPLAYRVQEFKRGYLFNGTTTPSVKIDQYNVKNIIEEIRRYERYAENIGMVQLLFDSLNTQSTGTKGFRYRLNLQSYTP